MRILDDIIYLVFIVFMCGVLFLLVLSLVWVTYVRWYQRREQAHKGSTDIEYPRSGVTMLDQIPEGWARECQQ